MRNALFNIGITVGVLFIVGCSAKEYQEKYAQEQKDKLIPSATEAKSISKDSLIRSVGEDIKKAAFNGKTEDSFYMGWFGTDEVVDVIIVLKKQGYQVRVKQVKTKDGKYGIEWLYVAWGNEDEFNTRTQEEFDKR